jgi:flotillin
VIGKVGRVTGRVGPGLARARGLAEAEAEKAKGLAEAQALQARADALAQNQEAVIAQQLAEIWPEIVKAGAGALGNVDQMVVLNGADGVADLLTKALRDGRHRSGARPVVAVVDGREAGGPQRVRLGLALAAAAPGTDAGAARQRRHLTPGGTVGARS